MLVLDKQSLMPLRAAPRKYQLDLEIAKTSNFSKLAQNEALRALVTKYCFKFAKIQNYIFFYVFFFFSTHEIVQNRLKMSGIFRGSETKN